MTSLQEHTTHPPLEPTFGQGPRAMPTSTYDDVSAAADGRSDQGVTGAAPASAGVNVGEAERQVSMAAGGILVGLGLSRRTAPGLLVAAVGAGLIHRGLTGHCGLYEKFGMDSTQK